MCLCACLCLFLCVWGRVRACVQTYSTLRCTECVFIKRTTYGVLKATKRELEANIKCRAPLSVPFPCV